MVFLRSFLWLTKEAMAWPVGLWPITLALVVLVIVAMVFRSPFRVTEYARWGAVVLAPFLLTVVILLFGAVFRHDGLTDAPAWRGTVLVLPLFAHFPACIILAYHLPKWRWFIYALSLLQAWVSLWAAFIASMSVTGDWL